MYVHVYVQFACVPTGTRGGYKWARDPLELKLQAGVSFPTWVLGVEIESSGRATGVLHSRAVSAGPQVNFKKDFKAL